MTATLAGLPILRAELVMPSSGVWTAMVEASGTTGLVGRVVLDDGGIQFRGTVRTGGVYSGRVQAAITGGAGALSTPVDAKPYRAATAKAVISDLLNSVGETLSLDSDPAVLATLLPFWQRHQASAGVNLTRLVHDVLDANWRVKRDGTIWVGRDSYPVQALDHVRVETDEAQGLWVIGCARSELLPAVTFEGRQVRRVVHQIGQFQRSEVWLG